MRCATLFFTHKGKTAVHDDVITITPIEQSRGVFEVVYKTPEMKERKFLASFNSVLQYVEDTLTSMRHDTDPFERIQVNTSIHPIVMYHVADMDDSSVRDLILNMVGDSMKFDVRLIRA